MKTHLQVLTLSLFLCVVKNEESVGDGLEKINVRQKREDIVPVNYFEQFGYLPQKKEGQQHDEQSLKNAIKDFQRMAGLKVTGNLSPKTLRKMKQPRCGLPDVIRPGDRIAPETKPASRNQPQQFNAPGYKWDKTDLTYKFSGYSRSRHVSQSGQRRAIRNAFNKWSEVTPLTFRESSSNNADILIDWTWRDHRDGSPFDGRGGTLAHAFFPGKSAISGDTHFDEEEMWTENTEDGTNLEIVAAHEFGHALGLGHSATRGALMQPFYGGYDPNYQLHSDDIRGIQSLYGARARRPATPRPRTTKKPRQDPKPNPRPNPKPKPPKEDICTLKFDDIANGPDRRLYAFRGKKVYKFKSNGVGTERGFPKNIRKVFPRAPSNIGSAVYDSRRRYFYIFKTSKVWRYTNFRLDSGFPKRLKKGFYRNANAALQNDRGEILLLKGDSASVWREDFAQPPRGYPVPITRIWNGLRSDLEAAINYNRQHYFFKGANYFKYDTRRRQIVYRKPKAGPWLGCGRVEPK